MSYPLTYIFKLITSYMYDKYIQKILYAICRIFMQRYLAMTTDRKLNQTMLLEIIACLLVVRMVM